MKKFKLEKNSDVHIVRSAKYPNLYNLYLSSNFDVKEIWEIIIDSLKDIDGVSLLSKAWNDVPNSALEEYNADNTASLVFFISPCYEQDTKTIKRIQDMLLTRIMEENRHKFYESS